MLERVDVLFDAFPYLCQIQQRGSEVRGSSLRLSRRREGADKGRKPLSM